MRRDTSTGATDCPAGWMVRAVLLVALASCVAGCTRQAERASEAVITGPTMGTTYTVKVVGDNVDSERLSRLVESELTRINSLMSTYDAMSELSRLNRGEIPAGTRVSQDLVEVLALSRQVHETSAGAFDVTVGPLVNLWGFGPDPALAEVPADEDIRAALAMTGMDAVPVDGRGVVQTTGGSPVQIDLSAIAKGYAVDRLAEIVAGQGYAHFLVEVGGELKARGNNGLGRAWSVAVEKPDSLSRSIFKVLPLRDLGMATSGDYRNYFEAGGQRYSHTIDPRTGRPITHNVASVTVLSKSASLADGYATAINVMGLEPGLALAEAQDLAVLVIIKDGDSFAEHASPAMVEYLGQTHENGNTP